VTRESASRLDERNIFVPAGQGITAGPARRGSRRGAVSSAAAFCRIPWQEVVMAPESASPPPATFREASRVLTSVLAPHERRVLIALATRMPRAIGPDHLTGLALLAMVGAGLSYWLAATTPLGLVLVVACLAINWFGDSLDGTLARVRRQPRPRYGFYVDHVVDSIGAACLLGGLALSGYMHPLIALGLLAAYLLLASESYLATHAVGEFRLSYFKVGPTELRILLAIGTLALLWRPMVHIGPWTLRLFDVGGAVAIAGLVVTFLVAAGRHTRMLYLAEPVPPASDAAAGASVRTAVRPTGPSRS
jgi:phosphatidylglycerophosphate synthase